MQYSWAIYALLSAIFAALVAIFGKIGLKNFDSNVATTIRALIMTAFLFLVILLQGKMNQINEIISNNKALLFIVLSGFNFSRRKSNIHSGNRNYVSYCRSYGYCFRVINFNFA